MAPAIVYITGFRQHAGKTVTALGLISQLRKRMDPSRIGYLKPVGQELVTLPDGTQIDKDAAILKKFAGIPDLDLALVSPVRLGSGFTQEYLDSEDHLRGTRDLQDAIIRSLDALRGKDVIIAEGTGHPGVGGIVGLSNADVANLMGAGVVFLSGGGIGKALDMLEVDLSYFLYKKSRVRGIIFNKVIPDKVDSMAHYITEDLLNSKYGAFGGPLRILGFLPEIGDLGRPSMKTILERFPKAEPIWPAEDPLWEVPCAQTRIISVDAESMHIEEYIRPLDVIILAASSRRRVRKVLDYHARLGAGSRGGAESRGGSGSCLGGLVLTCGKTDVLDPAVRAEVIAARLPAIIVNDDTATAEQKILGIYENTKLQVYDRGKIAEIEALFEEHFQTDRFLETFRIGV
jgi:uncharacterized protein